ncbi:hypothetical protein ACK3SF_04160 [Candidatus Nanosalina sp. VS9-1]|uniref:hypothetical protein n=1 Tax=Candidatus Nanosalina sp. VS9-1 TaxID=3388566 RepID=UPI0039E1667F
MGLFGGSDGDEKEEVTLGMPDNEEESDKGSSAEVRDLDFGSDENDSEASSTGSRLERQVESQVATPDTDDSGKDISLEDVHRQNEEIKDKLDTVLSRL